MLSVCRAPVKCSLATMHASRRHDGARGPSCLRGTLSSSFPEAAQASRETRRRASGAVIIPDQTAAMSDQTYDDGRARNLERLLRALADRIRELDAEGRLLANPAELTRLIGDVKSELFHYEVRATYDTPEVADSRRIVNEAIKQAEQGGGTTWQKEWTEDGDDAPEW